MPFTPIIEPLNPLSVWEHTPADYFRRGEYPRFIRPVRPPDYRMKWVQEKQPDFEETQPMVRE